MVCGHHLQNHFLFGVVLLFVASPFRLFTKAGGIDSQSLTLPYWTDRHLRSLIDLVLYCDDSVPLISMGGVFVLIVAVEDAFVFILVIVEML